MSTRSRFVIRQSVPPVVVTRTRRGTVVELASRRLPVWTAVLGVMLASVISAATSLWLAAAQPSEAVTAAEAQQREDKAFQAGREVAYEEMSQGMAQVYEQGHADGLAVAAEARARGGVR